MGIGALRSGGLAPIVPPPVLPSLYEIIGDARAQIARKTDSGPETGVLSAEARAGRPSSILEVFRGTLAPAQLTGWNFDWDDNIFYMPTEIRLYNKDTGELAGVSTADFALIREQIGKPGKWERFEMRADSLAAFGDDPEGKRNFFAEDVQRRLTIPASSWKGPSWDAFVTACSRRETAQQTTIITARLHSPQTIYAGLRVLQKLGYIKYLPPIENIYPVSYPPLAAELGGSASNPSAAKAIVMKKILDRMQATKIRAGARKVITPSGDGKRAMHLWGFSDDDFGNYKKALDALSADIKRWPNVKITVFFTGKNHPTEKPRAEVIMPDGRTRLATAAEAAEARRVLPQRESAAMNAARS